MKKNKTGAAAVLIIGGAPHPRVMIKTSSRKYKALDALSAGRVARNIPRRRPKWAVNGAHFGRRDGAGRSLRTRRRGAVSAVRVRLSRVLFRCRARREDVR